MSRLGNYLRPRIQDWTMRLVNDLRAPTLDLAEGDVLEVGFGTGLNLGYYPRTVKSVVGLDPMEHLPDSVEKRVAAAPFPVQRCAIPADGELPFDDGRFDCILTTWTLCSIDRPTAALVEMRRVLKPGGRYVFIEHGRSSAPRTAKWQDRLNPIYQRIADGCNLNRSIDRLVEEAGFELTQLDRFVARGPRVLAEMYRGVAQRGG